MAVSQVSLGFPAGAKLFVDTASSSAAAVAMAVASAVIYSIQIDNTVNAAAASYVKFWNTAGAVVIGTTIPDLVVMAPANTKFNMVIPEGLTFGTGVAIATTTAGGTAGAVAPGVAVPVRVVYV
jgi:hypothetical protein